MSKTVHQVNRRPPGAASPTTITTMGWRLAISGAVVSLLGFWLVVAPYRDVAANVRVEIDAMPFQCGNQEQTTLDRDRAEADEPAAHLITAEPGLNCLWRFFVVNGSNHEVTVDRITAPYLAPGGGGPGVQAEAMLVHYNDIAATMTDSDRDAFWPVDDTMLPGESLYYEIQLGFDESGCSSPDALLSLAANPVATIEFRRRATTTEPAFASVSFMGTEASSCDEP